MPANRSVKRRASPHLSQIQQPGLLLPLRLPCRRGTPCERPWSSDTQIDGQHAIRRLKHGSRRESVAVVTCVRRRMPKEVHLCLRKGTKAVRSAPRRPESWRCGSYSHTTRAVRRLFDESQQHLTCQTMYAIGKDNARAPKTLAWFTAPAAIVASASAGRHQPSAVKPSQGHLRSIYKVTRNVQAGGDLQSVCARMQARCCAGILVL